MNFSLLSTVGASLAGTSGNPNEDAWGVVSNMAWVIDGASQPRGAQGSMSTTEFVRSLDHELRDVENWVSSLTGTLSGAIERIDGDRDDSRGPSATIALVRWHVSTVEWLVLGDASIITKGPSGFQYISDTRLEGVATQERAALLRSRSLGLTDIDSRWTALVDAERMRRNKPGGYGVVTADPSAVEYARHGVLDTGGSLVLGTDGFLDGLERGHLWASLEAMYDEVCNSGDLQALLREVKIACAAAGNGKVDDATVVRVSCSG